MCFVAAQAASAYLPGIILGEATVYSRRYSEARFRRIDIGMSSTEVKNLLGSPLKIERDEPIVGGDTWKYSDQKTISDNFYRRWLIIKDNKIVDIFNDFWYD
jgi:hypothetical protein